MSISPGSVAWKLAFQLSPIFLSGGLVQSFPGIYVPIIAFTEAINFPAGLLSGGDFSNLDNFFANFEPLPGSTLIDQDIGRYPFANQTVAGNAVIAQPLTLSMKMTAPARGTVGYFTKLAIMTALVEALKQHNAVGGIYHVATPAQIYFNVVMRKITDISTAETKQTQNTWQLDFEKPLLTLEAAQGALNNLFAKISSFVPLNGLPNWSSIPLTVGQSISGASAVLSPATAAGTIVTTPLPPLSGSPVSPNFGGT